MNKTSAILGIVTGAVFSISTHAATLTYTANLLGSAEAPPNASTGLGVARVTLDTDVRSMRVETAFISLTAPTTVAHIHCCTALPGAGTAGVATALPTFPDFPANVTAGVYDRTFDMTQPDSFNPAFVTANGGSLNGAFDALLAGLNSGSAYLNIHSTNYPAGEIRGFLVAPVPLPMGLWLLGAGISLLGMRIQHRA